MSKGGFPYHSNDFPPENVVNSMDQVNFLTPWSMEDYQTV